MHGSSVHWRSDSGHCRQRLCSYPRASEWAEHDPVEGVSVNSLTKICHSGKREDLLMKIGTKLEVTYTRAVTFMLPILQQMLIKNLKGWCEDWNCHLPWVCLFTYSFLQGTAGVLVLFACQLITYAMTHPYYGMGKWFLASNSSSH